VIADATVAVLWVSVTLYAILGGADFGGGLWDLLAGGTAQGRRPRALIDHAIGPVWETNHVWLIFDLVILWTAFSAAFAAIFSALFDPLMLAVFAIVLRGAGFAFRKTLRRLPLQALTGGIFASSSLAAPFFMGTAIGAIAAGRTWAVRPLAAAAVAAVIWGWGVAQWPYLLPPSLTVQAGQAPGASLAAILAISGLVAVLVGPGMIVLFTLRNKGKLSEEDERDVTEADLPGLQAADADASSPQPAAGGGPGPPARPRLRNLAFAAAGFLAGAALARRNGGTRTESDVRNP